MTRCEQCNHPIATLVEGLCKQCVKGNARLIEVRADVIKQQEQRKAAAKAKREAEQEEVPA